MAATSGSRPTRATSRAIAACIAGARRRPPGRVSTSTSRGRDRARPERGLEHLKPRTDCGDCGMPAGRARRQLEPDHRHGGATSSAATAACSATSAA